MLEQLSKERSKKSSGDSKHDEIGAHKFPEFGNLWLATLMRWCCRAQIVDMQKSPTSKQLDKLKFCVVVFHW
jgi:hypothetical protein